MEVVVRVVMEVVMGNVVEIVGVGVVGIVKVPSLNSLTHLFYHSPVYPLIQTSLRWTVTLSRF